MSLTLIAPRPWNSRRNHCQSLRGHQTGALGGRWQEQRHLGAAVMVNGDYAATVRHLLAYLSRGTLCLLLLPQHISSVCGMDWLIRTSRNSKHHHQQQQQQQGEEEAVLLTESLRSNDPSLMLAYVCFIASQWCCVGGDSKSKMCEAAFLCPSLYIIASHVRDYRQKLRSLAKCS